MAADLYESRAAWAEARARYDNPGKNKARLVPLRIMERLRPGGRYLDLSGGGRSAELARKTRPDLEIVSAETDARLWPALLDHASRWGYTPLLGSFQKASGQFDLIYLDLTGNSSETSMRLVRAAAKMLAEGGVLVVTITPDRELDSAVSLNRPVTVATLLMAEAGRQLVGALRYANGDGKRVTLCVLSGQPKGIEPGVISRALGSRSLYPFWARSGHAYIFGSDSTRSRATPEGREKSNAVQRRPHVKARRLELQRIRRDTDEYRAQNREAQRERRRRNPEKVRAYDRAHYAVVRDRKRAAARLRYATDELYREKVKRQSRASYARKKLTAVSGTAAEAISLDEAA